MDFLKDFGVSPILLAAQVVNFLILLFILKRFLYKPILQILEKRKELIAKTVKNAEESEKIYQQASEKADRIIANASDESKKILDETNKSREILVEEGKIKGEELAQKIAQEARVQMLHENEQLRQNVRLDTVNIVLLALQKVTGKTFNKKDQKDLIEKAVKEIGS